MGVLLVLINLLVKISYVFLKKIEIFVNMWMVKINGFEDWGIWL